MVHHSLPAESSTVDKGKTSADDFEPKLEVSQIHAQDFLNEDEDLLTDASSIYSQDGMNDDFFKRSLSVSSLDPSRGARREVDPSLPYRAIIAAQRARIFPEWLKDFSYDNEASPSESGSQMSTSSSVQSEDFHHLNPAGSFTSSKSSYEKASDVEHKKPSPILYAEPHFQMSGNIKAVRFQDTADNLASPSTELSKAEGTRPLWIGEKPTLSRMLPRRSNSVLNLGWSRSIRNRLTSQSSSTLLDDRPRNSFKIKRTHVTGQAYHPLTNAPVRKGWVRRMARAFTERGQKGTFAKLKGVQ
ncbi:hypothetical protein BU25DRAFT_481672 [Macroventuria anomochaeta]|uniref:Uncharacterized protein n=1 Tax=Macroventuria anomochaeta TaxID=301207 RepID=A0ACB6SB02_9PLEO|nr:uncharacterized protein BU25DRAFT_481672 [Macroventuria anomochaeta]KAF2631153.1 hypothetical protein BU25DRAFT_481672 [Macroventuria anomochaeta]